MCVQMHAHKSREFFEDYLRTQKAPFFFFFWLLSLGLVASEMID